MAQVCSRNAQRTLEETLEINKLWVDGKGFASNERRSNFIRSNFIAHLDRAAAEKRKPKAMIKMGARRF